MMRVLIALLCLVSAPLFAAGAWDTPQARQDGFGSSPQCFNFTAPASGRAVVVAIALGGGASGGSVADDPVNSYSLLSTQTDVNGNELRWYMAHNVTNAPTEWCVAFTSGGSTNISIHVAYATGLATVSPLDDSDEAGNSFGTSVSGSLTTTVDGSLLIGWLSYTGDVTMTPTAGLSRIPATGVGGPFLLYSTTDAGTAGAKTIGATWTASEQHRISSIALKASGGGGGGAVVPIFIQQMSAANDDHTELVANSRN